MANNPLEEERMLEKKGGGTKLSPALSDLVQCAVSRILKGEQSERINFGQISEFADNISLDYNIDSGMPNNFWVVNTGVTCHN